MDELKCPCCDSIDNLHTMTFNIPTEDKILIILNTVQEQMVR